MPSKLKRLIARIAEESSDQEEALEVVRSLALINDWDNQIKKQKALRRNRERKRVESANSRAMKSDLTGDLTFDEWLETLADFNWKCAYCQENYSYEHLEHFIPLVKGKEGTDAWNYVPSCRACNAHKHTKDMDDWLVQPSLETMEDPFLEKLRRVEHYLQVRREKAVSSKKVVGKTRALLGSKGKYQVRG